MKVVYFTHSLQSCWNHGNAHFVRGVLRELIKAGHQVQVFEPAGSWSLANLLADHGADGLTAFAEAYPELTSTAFDESFDPAVALDGADLVIAHEWNEPALIAALGRARTRGGRFTLLFHDTHHRAVSDPDAICHFDLSGYDGVLAFGEALAEIYRGWGWGRRVFVWHEAADTALFAPPANEGSRQGLVWIDNWGDGERKEELQRFLLAPAQLARLRLDIHGVRYPPEAQSLLLRFGAVWRGWLPNAEAPEVFAEHLATVHVPRRFYARSLPGIPTIRVFEALACGIPLLSAPWSDAEGLFRPGQDYLIARTGTQMTAHMNAVAGDPALRAELVRSGLETIRGRHTCAHRVAELMTIAAALHTAGLEVAA